jgi:hypothetical protein
MSAEDWRVEYLSNELVEYRKRLEETEKLVQQAEQELKACEWQRDKAKAIVEMLEVAYKVRSTNHKEQSSEVKKDA